MAIFNSIALGRAKQSLGNVTTVVLKGQAIAKQKITSTTNRNTEGQVDQRNQLRNVVKVWPYFKAFLTQLKSQVRSTESIFNAYVRMFINVMPIVPFTNLNDVLSAVPDGNYGSGAGLNITGVTVGAGGLSVAYSYSTDLWKEGDAIKAFLVNGGEGQSYQALQSLGAGPAGIILIPDTGVVAGDVSILGVYAISEDGMITGSVQIITSLIA